MKFPRGVSGDTVIRILEKLGYTLMRQNGSHARLRHDGPPAHLVTVPKHNPMKTGTLHSVLTDVAQMRGIPLDELTKLL